VSDETPSSIPPKTAPKRSVGRRVAAIAVGAVMALLLAEGFLRVFDVAPLLVTTQLLENLDDPSVRYQCYSSNPNGEFQALPDVSAGRWRLRKALAPPVDMPLDRADDTPWCVEYRHRSFGVRGPAAAQVPPPGVLRIAGIGDSFAYGDGVPEDRTLFAHLARELGDGVEVLNCAQSGADMALDVKTLEWAIGHFVPQRAIVVFVPNDVHLSPALKERESDVFDLINVRAAETQDGAGPWYVRASHVARLLGTFGDLQQTSADTLALYRDAYDPDENGDGLALLRADFRNLSALSGGSSVLVLYPLMVGFEDGYPLQDAHDRVRAMAEEEGLRVLDLARTFAGRDTESLWVHDVDHHPNGTAHAIAAKALAAFLRDDVPGFLSRR